MPWPSSGSRHAPSLIRRSPDVVNWKKQSTSVRNQHCDTAGIRIVGPAPPLGQRCGGTEHGVAGASGPAGCRSARNWSRKSPINVDKLVSPYIEKLKQTALDPKQRAFLSIIENNLADLISPFISKTNLHERLPDSTGNPRWASLVRSGSQTKEIADLLDISVNCRQLPPSQHPHQAGP